MGSMLNAECACGYRSEGLMAGAGMSNFEKACGAPAYCEHCREAVTADYLAASPRCPKCGGRPVFYDDPSLRAEIPGPTGEERPVFEWRMEWAGKVFRLPDAAYLCPRCGEKTMRFSPGICFD